MTADAAWEAYRALRSDRRIGYLTEPNGLSEDWRAFTKGRFGSPNLWTDSFLCAFAQAAGLTLVTLDAKIPSREGLSRVVLRSSI